jgi:arsenate reductase (thioredoxin)
MTGMAAQTPHQHKSNGSSPIPCLNDPEFDGGATLALIQQFKNNENEIHSHPHHKSPRPMHSRIYNVLFICTGNSARSIMAEGLMNTLGQGRFMAYSAGSHPKGAVHPLALETLAQIYIEPSGFSSKSWDQFAQAGAPKLDFVFTVCDNAAGEVCPVWPGQPMTAHWGLPDPAAVTNSEAEQRRAFKDVAHALKRRIELMLALPLEKLAPLSLQNQLDAIGKA